MKNPRCFHPDEDADQFMALISSLASSFGTSPAGIGRGHEVTLHLITPIVAKQFQLLPGLNSFGYDFELQTVSHREPRPEDR